MKTWPGWIEVQESYPDHLCDLDALFEYIFRRILKALFGKDGIALKTWFISRLVPEMNMAKIAIETIYR